MYLVEALRARSESKCELCSSSESLGIHAVSPRTGESIDDCALLCEICRGQIETPDKADMNHWRCLNDSMWSQVAAVQVLDWRMLTYLSVEGWPQDLLFLDDDTLAWARATGESDDGIKHTDSNGAILKAGDTVTLTRDLNVKGAGFIAKRGTAVRNISLVADNPDHVEGKVNRQTIVILTKFVKKSN